MSDYFEQLRTALIDRYVIDREIGSGGMATVYLAEDLKHDRQVAVKVLNPELTSLVGSTRFLREIEIAARLNHPHILTLIDSGDADGLLYYVMPFVEQMSLREQLRREQRLSIGDALRVTQQVASALEYAHREGVIHRDIKPENVLLHEGVAMVADFGIALPVDDATGKRITGIGLLLGTPEYMSPEQSMGLEPDARSDVYSLACVLYEMLTGVPPFTGDDAHAVFAKRLTEPVPSLRSKRDDLPAELDEVLATALARDRVQRFSTMADFADRVTVCCTGKRAFAGTRRGAAFFRSPRVVWAAVVLLTIGVGSWLTVATRGGGDREMAPLMAIGELTRNVQPRQSIAVLGFKNLSGRDEVAWLSTALAEMLTTELAVGRMVRMVPGEVVSRMKVELSLADAESFGSETLSAIGQNLGTDMVVLGSFVAVGDPGNPQIRLDVRLQNTEAGETVASIAEAGTANELFDLVARTGTRLRDEMGLGGMSVGTESAVRALQAVSTEAASLYARGLEQLRRFNASGAQGLLEQSLGIDPRYAPAHSALSRVWSQLGYDLRARNEATLAYNLSDDLSDDDRLLVEVRLRETERDWDRTIEIYRKLLRAHPDNLEFGLGLASAQRVAGSRQEAMETIEALKQLPAPLSEDARVELAECHIAELLGEYEREQRACAEGRIKATTQGAVLLVARSWFLEGRSWYFLNDTDKSFAALDEAKRLYERTGHRSEVANVLNASGIIRRTVGDRAAALRDTEEALAIKRAIGEKAGIAMVVNSLGILAQQGGDLERATELYEEAIALQRELGNEPSLPAGMINLANVLARRGDLEGARDLYREAGSIAVKVDNIYTHALSLNNLRVTLFDLGDIAAARRAGEFALRRFTEIGHQLMLGYANFGLGEIAKAEDDLGAARTWHDTSLAIRERLELRVVQESQRALATLLLEEETFAEAEVAIRESTERFPGLPDAEEGHMQALLARALAGQGKEAEAREAADRARNLLDANPNIKNRLLVNILVADVDVDGAGFPNRRRRLEATLQEAVGAGYVPLQLEARLALGKLELAYGSADDGRQLLNELEREAARRGFRLVARKAREAMAAR